MDKIIFSQEPPQITAFFRSCQFKFPLINWQMSSKIAELWKNTPNKR